MSSTLSDAAIVRRLAQIDQRAFELRDAADLAAANVVCSSSIELARAWAGRVFPLALAALHLIADARLLGFPTSKRHTGMARAHRNGILCAAEDVTATAWITRGRLHEDYPAHCPPAPGQIDLTHVRAVAAGAALPRPLASSGGVTADLFA